MWQILTVITEGTGTGGRDGSGAAPSIGGAPV